MGNIYFPSCNFTTASPEAAKRIREYLSAKMPVADCCRVDQLDFPEGSTAVYFCQACRGTLEDRAGGRFILQNLFQYLDADADYPWPDYTGLTVKVQDCWRDREHPEIFTAVRNVLQKMHVSVMEMNENRARSHFCGNLHFEPRTERSRKLLEPYREKPLYELPEDVQRALMQDQVETLPCELAVTYCNRCKAGILMGGGKAVHLLELATGTFASYK